MTLRRAALGALALTAGAVAYLLVLGQAKWLAEAAIEDCRFRVGAAVLSGNPEHWDSDHVWPGGHRAVESCMLSKGFESIVGTDSDPFWCAHRAADRAGPDCWSYTWRVFVP